MVDKLDVKRADKEQADKLAMLKELAKLTKPTGASAKGRAEEKPDEEE